MKKDLRWEKFRDQIVGLNQMVPLIDGSLVTYDFLDNASSTPPFYRVKEKVEELMNWYATVHRGTGIKSLVSTYIYEEARDIIAAFVGADQKTESVIFCKNTSEAILIAASSFPFSDDGIVLSTMLEHQANDYPWQKYANNVIYIDLLPDGTLDMGDYKKKLKAYSKKIQLVTVTGASNITGYIPPIYEMAKLAHQAGVKIFIDCAQLFAHRIIQMGCDDSQEHLDFIAFSGHKAYSPYGTGVLIGPKTILENSEQRSMLAVSGKSKACRHSPYWIDKPEFGFSGSPNLVGIVALAASLQQISELGMANLEKHESEITHYAISKFAQIKGINLYGFTDPERIDDRIGIIPFSLIDIPNAKAAAILSFEGGIGLGYGCFCAPEYINKLLNPEEKKGNKTENNNNKNLLLRISLGCFSNYDDVDRVYWELIRLIKGDFIGKYQIDLKSGNYYPEGFDPKVMGKFFTI